MFEYKVFNEVRVTEEVVGMRFTWLLENISRFVDGKDEKEEIGQWKPVILMYTLGVLYIFVNDPQII